jgi:hypothetical protein
MLAVGRAGASCMTWGGRMILTRRMMRFRVLDADNRLLAIVWQTTASGTPCFEWIKKKNKSKKKEHKKKTNTISKSSPAPFSLGTGYENL